MNSPTAEMIKAARKGVEVARYLRWGPTIEGRHLMNAVAAYEEAIEALREAQPYSNQNPGVGKKVSAVLAKSIRSMEEDHASKSG